VSAEATDNPDVALIQKLGYMPNQTVCLLHAPSSIKKYLQAINTQLVEYLPADWLQAFCLTEAEFTETLRSIDLPKVAVGLWFCWPKKSSGQQTDLHEQNFRDVLLLLGWVDTKVCSIDATWSGLKFVRRRN
jgi:hypothetical protein